jgi:hypothetical protein
MSQGSAVSAGQFGVLGLYVIIFVTLTVRSWSRLQLDR